MAEALTLSLLILRFKLMLMQHAIDMLSDRESGNI